MTMRRLRCAAATDVGRVREHNEDAYALRADEGIFVVCDGMGGMAAGEVASRMAIEAIVDGLCAANESSDEPRDRAQGYRWKTRRLAEAIRQSNTVVYEQARETPGQAGMGTTVVAAWVDQDIASVAHVGDSRAYLWRHHRLEALTSDHSLVEAQVSAGVLDRESSLKSRQQNILLRALGAEATVEVEISEVAVAAGDYLLLCSDGLTTMVPEVAMAQMVGERKDPQAICEGLIVAANENGGADNITVVVVEIVGGVWARVRGLWR